MLLPDLLKKLSESEQQQVRTLNHSPSRQIELKTYLEELLLKYSEQQSTPLRVTSQPADTAPQQARIHYLPNVSNETRTQWKKHEDSYKQDEIDKILCEYLPNTYGTSLLLETITVDAITKVDCYDDRDLEPRKVWVVTQPARQHQGPYSYQVKYSCNHNMCTTNMCSLPHHAPNHMPTQFQTKEAALQLITQQIQHQQQYLAILQRDASVLQNELKNEGIRDSISRFGHPLIRILSEKKLMVATDNLDTVFSKFQPGDVVLVLPGVYTWDYGNEYPRAHLIGLGNAQNTIINITTHGICITEGFHISNVTLVTQEQYLFENQKVLEIDNCIIRASIHTEELFFAKNCVIDGQVRVAKYATLVVLENCTIQNCKEQLAVQAAADRTLEYDDDDQEIVIINTKFVNNVGMDIGLVSYENSKEETTPLVFDLIEENGWGLKKRKLTNKTEEAMRRFKFYGEISTKSSIVDGVNTAFLDVRPKLSDGAFAPIYVFTKQRDKKVDEYETSTIAVQPEAKFVNDPPKTLDHIFGPFKLVSTDDGCCVYHNDNPEGGDGSQVCEYFMLVFTQPLTIIVADYQFEREKCNVCNSNIAQVESKDTSEQIAEYVAKFTKTCDDNGEIYICKKGHIFISFSEDNSDGYFY